AALARLSGARLTVSLQHWRTRPVYRAILPRIPDRHEVEKYHAIAEAVLAPPARRGAGAMELHVSRKHRARADALLADLRVPEAGLLVAINAGATMEVKR